MEKRIRLASYSVNVQFIQIQHAERKPVCIFLHEALGSIVQWKQFPSLVCRELGLSGLVIERRGHGLSDPLEHARTTTYLHDYTDELHQVLQEVFPIGTTYILVGHSDGATIALLYAARFPKVVKAVISLAAHTFVEEETLAGIPPAVAAYENGKLEGLKRIHGEKTNRLFYAWADTWQSPEFRNWDIRHEITSITCPVLALQGKNDQYGTAKQVDSIKEATPLVTTVLLNDCGHHPHLEKQTETVEIIREFLLQNPGISA